jgi:hypothetical protein
MRPAHKTISAGRLDLREQAGYSISEAARLRASELVLRPQPFRRSTYRFAASFIPEEGKGKL